MHFVKKWKVDWHVSQTFVLGFEIDRLIVSLHEIFFQKKWCYQLTDLEQINEDINMTNLALKDLMKQLNNPHKILKP